MNLLDLMSMAVQFTQCMSLVFLLCCIDWVALEKQFLLYIDS